MTFCEDMFSRVLEIPPASQMDTQAHFSNKLACETDPSDVYADIKNKKNDFTFVDVRSVEAYQGGHAQGAINIPHIHMTTEQMNGFPKGEVFVVYCWGPGCNGASKAAFKLSGLGFAVKEMIGGIEYWEREGYPVDKN